MHAYLNRVTHWQKAHQRPFYNEFVLDGKTWREAMPDAVEAFFDADGNYKAFVKKYGEETGVLNVRLRDDWNNPIG